MEAAEQQDGGEAPEQDLEREAKHESSQQALDEAYGPHSQLRLLGFLSLAMATLQLPQICPLPEAWVASFLAATERCLVSVAWGSLN